MDLYDALLAVSQRGSQVHPDYFSLLHALERDPRNFFKPATLSWDVTNPKLGWLHCEGQRFLLVKQTVGAIIVGELPSEAVCAAEKQAFRRAVELGVVRWRHVQVTAEGIEDVSG